jgi:hypothetical protein
MYPEASIKDAQATGEASALKREHPTLQNMKILCCSLFLWEIFVLLDPDPVNQIVQIHSDPDPELRNPVKV